MRYWSNIQPMPDNNKRTANNYLKSVMTNAFPNDFSFRANLAREPFGLKAIFEITNSVTVPSETVANAPISFSPEKHNFISLIELLTLGVNVTILTDLP